MIYAVDKLAAIKEVKKESLLKHFAANYGVGISTVWDWVKTKKWLYCCSIPSPKIYHHP